MYYSFFKDLVVELQALDTAHHLNKLQAADTVLLSSNRLQVLDMALQEEVEVEVKTELILNKILQLNVWESGSKYRSYPRIESMNNLKKS